MSRTTTRMKNPDQSWIEYWDTENDVREANWQNSMSVFLRATEPLLEYGPQDVVLDIGCGPGYLEASLKDTVKEIHGLDTSPRCLDLCKKKFARDAHLFFHHLPADHYTDLSFLPSRTFSIIVCNSVVQYYRDVGEVERLIEEVRRVALPGARFLIADIPTQSSSPRGTWRLLRKAFREHCLGETVKLMFRFSSSEYRKLFLSRGFLVIPVETLEEMIQRLKVDAVVLDDELTLVAGRRHVLVKF